MDKRKVLTYQRMIDKVGIYQKKTFWLIKKMKFNLTSGKVSHYFSILKNISLEKGWKLDFVYLEDGIGSSPVLYAYKNRVDRDATRTKIKRKYHSYHVYTNEYYWKHIKLNRTPDSYFEYVVLNILGCQFSLVWHANYNTFMPICTKRELLQVLESLKYEEYDKEERAAIAKIDPTPSVLISNKQAVVRLLVYAINQGFVMRDYYINKHFPHKITKIEDTQLVGSKINITF